MFSLTRNALESSLGRRILSSRVSRHASRAASLAVLVAALLWLSLAGVTSPSPTSAQPLPTLNHTFPAGWSLVSIPLQPQNGTPAAVFDEVPPPLRLNTYRDGDTVAADQPDYPDITPGRADWLLLTEETSVSVSGNFVSIAGDFEYPLSSGWNPISTPWSAPIDWADARVSIRNGSTTLPLSQAIGQGWVKGDLTAYDPATDAYATIAANQPTPGQLVPWSGYLLFSNIDGHVIFSPPPIDTTPPLVDITAPAEDTELTDQAPVSGTASDANLVQYTLELGVAGSGEFTTFDTDTVSVTNGQLGIFDPTVLSNDIYTIRLTAVDVAGNEASDETNVLVTGSNKPGIFRITFVDLDVPVSGIPITVERTYDSRERSASGDFGFGWSLGVKSGKYTNNRRPGDGWNFTRTIFGCIASDATKSHVTEIRFSDVDFYRFATQVTPAGLVAGGCFGEAGFTQTGGIPGATLEILGSTEVFWSTGSDQVVDTDTLDTFEPQDVRLTTADGRMFDLNRTQGLTALMDPNGNSLAIGPDGVTHSSGKSVVFTRDGSGRITKITDPEGNAINYSYDGQGDLVTVKDRAGSETTFAYQTGHFLTSIQDPLGNTPLRTEYNDEGRAVAYIDASGNRIEITTDLNANATSITDRLGNTTAIQYNDDGLVTEASSGSRTFQMAYDDKGNLLTRTDPLGNTHTFTYDSNNNLTSESDPLGNTTAYAYDSGGHLTSMTDANGATNDLTYDSRGNLLEIKDGSGLATMAATVIRQRSPH